MKKLLSLLLVLTMMLSILAGCANDNVVDDQDSTGDTSEAAGVEVPVEMQLSDIVAQIYTEQPAEFDPQIRDLDLTDMNAVTYNTGLSESDASMVTEAILSEPIIGSIPYSLVMVRVDDAANARTVAEAMKSGINQRKWICVEADSLQVSGYGDVVMLIMIGSEYGVAQPFTDAFSKVLGTELDFVI